ncbi:MAG: BatA domain-containing protein [Bacteroidota bacterium]|nr:BatA domain-containing protein [Bacteroidota bacterium]
MFSLLNPAALLALLGLLVPVAIHLWNRRPGREIAVGSLRWLAAGANRRLRNLKPEQLWLLLLRAALLAVLAVAVAGPVWRTALPTSRGVVLLSAEAAGLPALAGQRSTIDSLRRRGYVLRWLASGFPRVSGAGWRKIKAGQAGASADSIAASATAGSRGQEFAWARVQQATATFPGQPLLVLTSAALRHFGGSHPPLPAAVRWQALPDSTTATWLGGAALVGDSLQLLVGRSSENRTIYQRKKILKPRNGQPGRITGLGPLGLQSNKKGSEYLVGRPTRGGPNAADTIAISATRTVIEIYATPAYATDARYLEAGLRAAAAGLTPPPQLRRVTQRPARLQADWTFWLSDEPLPPHWQQDVKTNGFQLWQEAAAPGVADTARLAAAEAGAPAVRVFRRTGRAAEAGQETVWADGRGRPILARQRLGRGSLFQLHTRLNPIWSELADDPQLPTRLLELLQPEPNATSSNQPSQLASIEAAHDRRALAPAQLSGEPVVSAAPPTASAVAARTFRTTDLRPWLVLLAGLLLLLERLLARRRESLSLLTTP